MGSTILGPTLWNILYDEVMNISISVMTGTHIACYADDLVVVVTANSKIRMECNVNESLYAVDRWMKQHRLEIVVEKTKAIILNKHGKVQPLSFSLGGETISISQEVTYLGVVLDQRLIFNRHLQAVKLKAQKAVRALGAVMPNIKGPRSDRRRVTCLAAQSIVLYGRKQYTWIDTKI